MHKVIPQEYNDLIHAVPYRPAITIIMPFEPKMTPKHLVEHNLKIASDKVEKELSIQYPDDIHQLITKKLQAILKGINYSTHKRSIAIFLSPVFEKVLYLDISLKERIIIDESFEIRDLVYSKLQQRKYLVLVLSANESSIFLGQANSLIRIVANNFKNAFSLQRDMPERVANFSDPNAIKEKETDHFLHYIDNTLDIILNAYHLPIFIIGPEKIAGHFKKITRHASSVIDYINGYYVDATIPKLVSVLEPYLTDWKKVKQADLNNQLEAAAGKNKLVIGMAAVWSQATKKKGKLLLVEKDFVYEAEHGSIDEVIYKAIEPYNKFSYIRDAVDDVIEKVLSSGGDVEIVDNGTLENYKHIALIQYY